MTNGDEGAPGNNGTVSHPTGPDAGHQLAGENPAIVVVAHSRPQSLARLLGSLERQQMSADAEVPLVISIDDSVRETVEVAERFEWAHGHKRIIARAEQMGLRDHVLACGDLTLEYGSCVIFEDDLYASPDAYRYVQKALGVYADEPAVAGISLYGYRLDEYQRISFQPLDDGYDTFFMQTPSSWGQAWTAGQWSDFRTWYQSADDLDRVDLPYLAAGWSSRKSWKKYFLAYLIDTNRYFVFPRHSLTSNCGDPGTHFRHASVNLAAPITVGQRNWRFGAWSKGAIRYDAWYEPHPETIAKWWPDFGGSDVTVDFLGSKLPHQVRTKMLVSSRPCGKPEEGFPMILQPLPLNLYLAGQGRFFQIGRPTDFEDLPSRKRRRMIETLNGEINRSTAVGIVVDRVVRRIHRHETDPRLG